MTNTMQKRRVDLRLLEIVKRIWALYPHWRFGQLLTNVAAWADSPMSCIGEIEDDELVAIIKEHLKHKGVAPHRAHDLIDYAQSLLTNACSDKQIGAQSCILFIKDAWWPNAFRLVCKAGETIIPDALGGIYLSASAKQIIVSDVEHTFFADASNLSHPMQMPNSSLKEKRYLFDKFVRREKVQSCARLLHKAGDEVQASLFVNFGEREEFPEKKRTKIRELMKELTTVLPGINKELELSSPFRANYANKVIDFLGRLIFKPERDSHSQKETLDAIIEAVISEMGLEQDSVLGTIHLFDGKTGLLRLAASKGHIDNLDDALVQSVNDGEGVITWVVLHKRSIVLERLPDSPFSDIARRIRKGSLSEIAVPIMGADNVLGVLNIECTKESAFADNAVDILHFAAGVVAIACEHLEKLYFLDMKEQILEICKKAVCSSAGEESALYNDLAEIGRRLLKGDECFMWRFVPDKDEFQPCGTTHPGAIGDHSPRESGWTKYIFQHQIPMWFVRESEEEEFSPFFWNAQTEQWTKNAPSKQMPKSVKDFVIGSRMLCILGVPIFIHDQCMGVGWIKYENVQTTPSLKTMRTAVQFAGDAAIVVYQGADGKIFAPSTRIMNLAGDFFSREASPLLSRVAVG